MNISEKLKGLISQFFTYCLLVAGSSMVGIAVWTHAHAAEPIAANTLAVYSNTKAIASSAHISREIRHVSKRCDDLEKRLDKKRDQRTQILISPHYNSPQAIELKDMLDNEIKDIERDIEAEKRLLHEAEIKEGQQIARWSTA